VHPTSVAHRYDPPMPAPLPPPDGCAVVTMELQRGVVGDLASMPALVGAAVERATLDACARMVDGARRAGVPVVHARVHWAADRRGTPLNTPLTAGLARRPEQMLEGSAAVELVPELGDTSGDLHSWRRHGLTPFVGTDLDPLLGSLGVHTVVAVGVSLNIGVLGLCLGATDLGHRAVVPTDAVVGVPVEYGDAVLANSIAMVATLTTVDDLLAAWA
jgi:nicotinamidase-related amidase